MERVSRAVLAVLALFLPLLAACAATPADLSRRGSVPEFPRAECWPACDLARAAAASERIPDCVASLGSFGQGMLYKLKADKASPSWYQSSILIFRAARDPALDESSDTVNMRWKGGEWLVPFASIVMAISIRERPGVDHVGTCIYLSSLVGLSNQERQLVDEMILRGWRVIAIWPAMSTYAARAYMYPESPSDELAVAGLAASTDIYLASAAFGAEAALAYVEQTEPRLQERPVVLIGSSLGAISAPTVAARLRSVNRSRLDAAVLIGGGAGLISISSTSLAMRQQFSLTLLTRANDGSDAMVFRPTPPDEIDSIISRADDRARLDPLQTAASLRDVPVLLLHASEDEIVPAATGDALYERLGRPERWTYRTGHVGLFFLLPFEARNIAHWITQSVRGTHASPDDATHAASASTLP